MPVFFLVLGIAAVVLIATAGHRKHVQHPQPTHHPPGARLVELDSDLPQSLVDQVLVALGHDEDPARLDALAQLLSGHYPLSTGELQRKAWALRAGAVQAAPAPALSAASSPLDLPAPATAPPHDGSASLDAATVLQAAMRALAQETDPVVLIGFAESIRPRYPAAAEILAARALALSSNTSDVQAALGGATSAFPIEVPS
jgi:hypothetical protein